ncbi:MAG: DUF4160 domain-containing protein [Vicinamibacterales bacterium]
MAFSAWASATSSASRSSEESDFSTHPQTAIPAASRLRGVRHIHAVFAGAEASIELATGAVRGTLPPRASRLVLEWMALHRQELLENWQRARSRQPLVPVAPLE